MLYLPLSPAQCEKEMECFMLGFIISVDHSMVSKMKSATICSILCKIDVALELLAVFQFNPPCRFLTLLPYRISYYSAQTANFTIHGQLFVGHVDYDTVAGQKGIYSWEFFHNLGECSETVYILFIIMKQMNSLPPGFCKCYRSA